VEQTLRVREWDIWLDLVERVNPHAYAASQALDSWLGSECIAGGLINRKEPLCIKAELPKTIHEVEEVLDSEDEEDFSPTQSQVTVASVEPT
ncbi:hypothetical protein K469DRAFT_565313, partial [Zopfia rhizophila CBS 207.26]